MSVSELPPVLEPGLIGHEVKTVEYSAEQVGQALFGKDGPSFKDLVDAVNPLQQLPIVGTIYRYMTGETLSPGARLAGGALYGGAIGLAVAAANAALEGTTGRDVGDHLLAMVVDDVKPNLAPDAQPTLVASAEPPPLPTPKPELPAIGPAVTANPVAPVATAAAKPVAAPAATPQAKGDAALTPESYARAIAAANGRAIPAATAAAPPRGDAAPAAPIQLSNEDFARLLGAFGGGMTSGGATGADLANQIVAPPQPIPVPVAGAEARTTSRASPYYSRVPSRFSGR